MSATCSRLGEQKTINLRPLTTAPEDTRRQHPQAGLCLAGAVIKLLVWNRARATAEALAAELCLCFLFSYTSIKSARAGQAPPRQAHSHMGLGLAASLSI